MSWNETFSIVSIPGDCHDVCSRVSQDHLRTGRLLPHLHICPWHPPHQRSQRLQDQRSLSQLFCRLWEHSEPVVCQTRMVLDLLRSRKLHIPHKLYFLLWKTWSCPKESFSVCEFIFLQMKSVFYIIVQAGHCYFRLVQPNQLLWADRIQDWSLRHDKVR